MTTPVIEFPAELPVSAKRADIEAALAEHQVIIVCGETGSGKTTQLPKIALALGRGRRPEDGQRGQLIGHTQPRRLAATSVAARIAEELKTELGEVVGYKIRFQDRLQKGASIKLMTDGILLAETQKDPLLRAYDTLIIDEAHERSLNIDFLLGYLKQLLPRRPDLKVIVTSATIDADRFARHFAGAMGPAPVIMVSGRTYPVEVRYRPYEESREYGVNDAIADAVDELWRGGVHSGDVLVFLPGEREIRDAADHLRKHLSHHPVLRDTDVLPLFARLSAAEQSRIFHPTGKRRVVLATNVAETSLTVPGIRYVVDAGTARVKRYSLRSKVEQLLVEPISQAAANQRAGRCGRVAEGICIRLYDEKEFAARDAFTDPEILRSSLAAVILRMKSLGLGQVEDFPFLEAPSRRAITDGYQLLQELGAVDDDLALTKLGRDMARLPLDPRVARMILEARDRHALDEVLVVASALSVQDVRDRPIDAQAQADQAHAKFDDERSEFVGLVNLWRWLGSARGGAPAQGEPASHKLSNKQYEALLRQHFINVRRVREWRDTHQQLHTVVAEQGWRLNEQPATYEQLHLSLLSGLLGNVGCKSDTEDWYLGVRGIKFYRHPGAHLKKKPGRWLMCAELVETARLFGRGLANIEPQWLEQVGRHLLKKQLLEPHWEKKAADVVALERATLYGLVVYQQRRVPFSRLDPAGAREIFIREALVEALFDEVWLPEDAKRLPFLAANKRVLSQVQEIEHKSRRQDVLVDEALVYAFYDQHLPVDVFNGRTLQQWLAAQPKGEPVLRLTKDELMRHEAAGVTTQAFPKTLRLGGVDCSATYLHDPGDPKDGLTVTVPLFVLNQVNDERCEWLVPGMLKDKVQALLKSLPQKPRARLVPLPESAATFADALQTPERWAQGSLIDALIQLTKAETGLDIKRSDFKLDMLSAHHFMNIRLVDEHGRHLAQGRQPGALKSQWGSQARGAFQALADWSKQSDAAHTGATSLPPAGDMQAAATTAASPGSKVGSAPVDKAASSPNGASHGLMAISPSSSVATTSLNDRFTAWGFGEWPEIMEIKQGKQSLIGFPALIDHGDHVRVEVFDEPDMAAAKHRDGLRRLFALQIKDALKYLDKNLPDLQKMAVAYMPLGTAEELKTQILEVAIERAFMPTDLPQNAVSFDAALQAGRARLTLIAQEVSRLTLTILTEYQAAARKLKDSKVAPEVHQDIQQQLQRLLPKFFLKQHPWASLAHLPRYLKAVVMRLDKYKADTARDVLKHKEQQSIESRFWRLVAERKGKMDARLSEVRWLLEELRVSLFAQELRTPQPVSVKRLEKVWAQLQL